MLGIGLIRGVRAFSAKTAAPRSRHVRRFLLWGSLAGYGYYQYGNYSQNRELARRLDIPIYKILLYKAIPFGPLSHIAGVIGSMEIPFASLRGRLFKLFAAVYGCDLSEADRPVHEYRSFGEFFARPLRRGVRPAAKVDGLVCPSDGVLLHCGVLAGDVLSDRPLFPEQVKGSLYALADLVGETESSALTEQAMRRGSSLYYCTIYLAPGDYHRFHSPAPMKIDSAAHFKGESLSVAPWVMSRIPKLLCMNQRVSIFGRWKYGRLCYVPVGAANVSSIILNDSVAHSVPSELFPAGRELGHFELGSTIVLLFEGPRGMKWLKEPGAKLRLGEGLIERPSAGWWDLLRGWSCMRVF